MIMFDMQQWCIERGIEFVVTSGFTTEEEDKRVNRVHATHRTGRAFDLRSREFSVLQLRDFISYFSRKHHQYAAVNSRGEARLIVHHDSGSGIHLHIQIHSKYSMPYLTVDK